MMLMLGISYGTSTVYTFSAWGINILGDIDSSKSDSDGDIYFIA